MLPLLCCTLALLTGDPALEARIAALAESALRSGPIAGLSVGVAKGGDTLFARGFGYADLENDIPATADTVYRIGSITKQFTATAIMQLREAGRIAPEDELTKYLPDYPVRGHRVTIHQLLNHTSGIKSYTAMGARWLPTVPLDRTPGEMVDLFKDEPFDFTPGAKFAYNNSGYFLLGMLVEQLSGEKYGAYLEQHVFQPLGMTSTCYGDERRLIKHRAQGYARDPAGHFENDAPISMTQPFAAGALCSTVTDLIAWERALAENRLINDESYGLMTTPTVATGSPDPRSKSYGYGLFLGELAGHPVISHGGGINGFVTQLAHYPDDDLTIVVLTNTEGANPAQLEQQIAQVVLGIGKQ